MMVMVMMVVMMVMVVAMVMEKMARAQMTAPTVVSPRLRSTI